MNGVFPQPRPQPLPNRATSSGIRAQHAAHVVHRYATGDKSLPAAAMHGPLTFGGGAAEPTAAASPC